MSYVSNHEKNSARKKALSVDPNLPSDYPAMQRLPDAKEWLEAAQLELDGVRQCMTPLDFAWIRKHHPDTKILPSVLVSKIKRNTDGYIRVRKVRLCVGGHMQIAGDGTFDETFSPTAMLTSFRICLCLNVELGLRPYSVHTSR